MIVSVIEAGSALAHVRGEVCKAVRKGANFAEMNALLKAEELAQEALQRAIDAEQVTATGWIQIGTTPAGGRVLAHVSTVNP